MQVESDQVEELSNTHLVFEGCSIILIAKDHVKLRLAIENGEKLNNVAKSMNHQEICNLFNYEETKAEIEPVDPNVKDDFFLAQQKSQLEFYQKQKNMNTIGGKKDSESDFPDDSAGVSSDDSQSEESASDLETKLRRMSDETQNDENQIDLMNFQPKYQPKPKPERAKPNKRA